VRDRHERVRLVGAVLADGDLDEARNPLGDADGDDDDRERGGTPVDQRDDESEEDPEQSVRADLREEDEDVVERLPAMVDDPSLRMPVPAGQD
jgi:hypothetical protein